MAKIETFVERKKVAETYNKLLDIDFDFFDTFLTYDIITEKEFDELENKFNKMTYKLFEKLEQFDKEQIKNR